jgi:hypothetical protein
MVWEAQHLPSPYITRLHKFTELFNKDNSEATFAGMPFSVLDMSRHYQTTKQVMQDDG